jgi:hypothetical protein
LSWVVRLTFAVQARRPQGSRDRVRFLIQRSRAFVQTPCKPDPHHHAAPPTPSGRGPASERTKRQRTAHLASVGTDTGAPRRRTRSFAERPHKAVAAPGAVLAQQGANTEGVLRAYGRPLLNSEGREGPRGVRRDESQTNVRQRGSRAPTSRCMSGVRGVTDIEQAAGLRAREGSSAPPSPSRCALGPVGVTGRASELFPPRAHAHGASAVRPPPRGVMLARDPVAEVG